MPTDNQSALSAAIRARGGQVVTRACILQAALDPETLSVALRNACRRACSSTPTARVRTHAAKGIYFTKPGSRFAGGERNLPLDLWDSTPDP